MTAILLPSVGAEWPAHQADVRRPFKNPGARTSLPLPVRRRPFCPHRQSRPTPTVPRSPRRDGEVSHTPPRPCTGSSTPSTGPLGKGYWPSSGRNERKLSPAWLSNICLDLDLASLCCGRACLGGRVPARLPPAQGVMEAMWVMRVSLGIVPFLLSRAQPGANNLKGATSRSDKLDKGHPDYPRVAARLGPAQSGTLQTFRAWCRADVLRSRCQCKTTRQHGARGPSHRAGRLSGLRPPC